MAGVRTVRGRMMPLERDDVDTDQIMPKQFLTRVERTGYGAHVFHDWRQDPSFVFNDARFAGASVLVAGSNFGSGSSREHAVWGLLQYGFEAVVAPSFSDIFVGNCAQSGLLPVRVQHETYRALLATVEADPGAEVVVDLEDTRVDWPAGTATFDIDPMVREALLHGLDDVNLILAEEEHIVAYERRRPSWSVRVPVEGSR
ncbi:3-isopropylmalate dehydratase small subunit [Qaidamihabitans albus]|uniref:3-isopropylmalate dehydratase small subunit n=1 Tax=Qaidamihabitans albus TaxID=2795733 RepID=UPI0018F11844|nr:3-isopropylmalate dehydratase small subunit [Qaidamihabitans albus]